jgi:4-hydroxybutyrate dehydrogenase
VALIQYLTAVEFDNGALRTLPAALAELRVRRPLVVTDRGLVKAGLVDQVNQTAAKDACAVCRYPG